MFQIIPFLLEDVRNTNSYSIIGKIRVTEIIVVFFHQENVLAVKCILKALIYGHTHLHEVTPALR